MRGALDKALARRSGATVAPALLLGLLLLLLGAGSDLDWMSLGAVAGTYAIALLGLDIIWGQLGLMSLGQNGFVAVGAYATATLAGKQGLPPILALVAGMVVSGLLAFVLGRIVLRQAEFYFGLTTLGFGLIVPALLVALPQSFAGGAAGMFGIPSLSLGPLSADSAWAQYAATWVVALVLACLFARVASSRIRLAWRVISAHPQVAEAAGVNVTQTKLRAFVLSAVLGSVAGSFFAHLSSAITPTEFSFALLVTLLATMVVGGLGLTWGAIIGPIVMTLVLKYSSAAGEAQLLLYGAIFIVVVLVAPEGIAGAFPWLRRRLAARTASRAAPTGDAPAARMPSRASSLTLDAPIGADAPAGTPCLEVSGVSKSFWGVRAITDVSLTVLSHSIHGIIGPNGAGKSTLLNVVCGHYAADSGRVVFDGVDLGAMPMHQRSRLGIARTFQQPSLVADLTLAENVAIGRYASGRGGLFSAAVGRRAGAEYREALQMSRRLLDDLGLGHLAGARAADVSFGAQRIAELARAFLQRPRLLLLDEPTSGLGHDDKAALSDLLRAMARQGTTICLIEHDTEMVGALCDTITVFDRGKVIAEGTSGHVFADRAVIESYIGGGLAPAEAV